ncbi:MAG: hypothetical protein ACLFQV_06110 [Vulcanimicrobiota bacterium]
MLIYTGQIKKIIEGFFGRPDCELSKLAPEFWTVKINTGLEKELEEKSPLNLAFSRESHMENENSILLTTGSPLLKKISLLLEKNGLYGEGYLKTDLTRLMNALDEKPGLVESVNAETEFAGSSVEYHPIYRYTFLLNITGEERREDIIPIFFNPVTETVPGKIREELLDPVLSTSAEVEGSIMECKTIRDYHHRAQLEAISRTRPLLNRLKANLEEKKSKEKERVKNYFSDLLESARPAQKPSLEKTRKKYLQELEEKYSFEAELKVINYLVIHVPAVKYRIKITRGQNSYYIYYFYDLLENRYLPFECPRCGKEATKVQVCEKHGISCEEEGWICPVCNKERCPECEFFACTLDGRQKDPDCTFNCQFCQARTGKDHLVKCSICGNEGCKNCVVQSDDQNQLCPECGKICSECGRAFPQTEVTRCEMCPQQVCSHCGIKVCENCNKKACGQHSFICVSCEKVFCKDCLGGLDSSNDDMLCKKCALKCKVCGKTTSEKFSYPLEGETICRNCAIKCETCGNILNKKETIHCKTCRKDVCREHTSECRFCGDNSCKEHFNNCQSCEIDYCRSCSSDSENGDTLCKYCNSLEPLKKNKKITFLEKLKKEDPKLADKMNWKYSESRNMGVLYGESKFGDAIFVFNKKGDELIKKRKIGIMEKIKKNFGL